MELNSLPLKIAWMLEKFNGQTQVTIHSDCKIVHSTLNGATKLTDSKLNIHTILFIFSQFNKIISIEITICKHDIDCKTDKFFSSADRKLD